MEVNLSISVNISENVRFKPTAHGLDVYVNYWSQQPGALRSSDEIRAGAKSEIEKNDGFMAMQMWNAMAIFGPHLRNGGPQLIVGNRLHLTKYNAVMTIDAE